MESNDNVRNSAAEVIERTYRDRSTRFADRASRLAKYVHLVSTGRMVTFCAAVGCLVLASSNQAVQTVALVGSGLLLGSCAHLAVLHERLLRRHRYYDELHQINEHSLASMSRRWEQMRLVATEVPEVHAALDEDLDLFGWGSLFHLVCRASTPIGIGTLRDWFLHPAKPSVILKRQQAVAELTPQLELRQELEVRGRILAGSSQAFLDWTAARPWLSRRPWLRRLSIALGIVPSLVVALMLTNLIRPEMGLATVFLAVIANLVFIATFGARFHETFRKASSRHAGVREYVALFDLMAHVPETSDALAEIGQTAADRQHGACVGLRSLRRIMQIGNSHGDTFKTVMYLPLQVFFLWDSHVLAVLERWQRRWRKDARRWFEALGELEALSSLAALAHDNPAWPFPTVDLRAPKGIEASGLAHPLLPEKVRVANDVTVGPPGTFLLVTGSNMSGKTTLLRALGANVVLAQAGAPVSAVSVRMSPLVPATVMQIDDSLVEGVSMFMAALNELKRVVDLARRFSGRSDQTVIYLLDEVLRGTNTLERQIAARKVIGHLLAAGAIGAISSHDLDLAGTEPLAQACTAVHFCESIESDSQGPRMTFDYKMRPGVATSANALKLLKHVGLD